MTAQGYKFSQGFGKVERKRWKEFREAMKVLNWGKNIRKVRATDWTANYTMGSTKIMPYIDEDGNFDVLTDKNIYYRIELDRFEQWLWMVGGEKEHIHLLTF